MSDAGRKREAIKPVVNMTVEQDVFRAPEGGKAMSEFVPLQFEDVGKMRVELEQARAEIERLRAVLAETPRDIRVADSMIRELRAEIERLRVEVVALRAQHEGARDLDEWLAKHPEYAKAASTSRE